MAVLNIIMYLRISDCKPFIADSRKDKGLSYHQKNNNFVFSMCVNEDYFISSFISPLG